MLWRLTNRRIIIIIIIIIMFVCLSDKPRAENSIFSKTRIKVI